MSDTDVRITDLDVLITPDAGDMFVVVETGNPNMTKRIAFGVLSGAIGDSAKSTSSSNTAAISDIESDVDTISGNLNATGGHLANKMMYTIFAEEADPLNANTHEWSFGNGDNPPFDHGMPIVFNSELVGLGLDVERTVDGDITVEVYKDGVATNQSVTVGTNTETATTTFGGYPFAGGTKINFKTTTLDGAATSGRIIAYLKTVT
tara:strand:+ start:491 stop:1108 length:618 start_codon:yes stop_codon:yes gene_type:complete